MPQKPNRATGKGGGQSGDEELAADGGDNEEPAGGDTGHACRQSVGPIDHVQGVDQANDPQNRDHESEYVAAEHRDSHVRHPQPDGDGNLDSQPQAWAERPEVVHETDPGNNETEG